MPHGHLAAYHGGVAVINVLNILSSAFALYLFVVVRRMRIQGREHLILSLAALALFFWNASGYFVYNTQNLAVLEILLPASFIPMFLYFPLVFHFAYAVYRKRRLPAWLALLVYAPGVALSVLAFFAPVSLVPVVTEGGAIALVAPVGEPGTVVWTVYVVSCWVASLVLSVRYYRTTNLNRERRQGAILVTWFTICLIVVFSEFYLTAMVEWWTIPSQSPLLMSIWVGAMVYAIWKYGFLRISPQLLAEQILDSIEDIVVLYDMNGNRVYANRKAVAVIGTPVSFPFGGQASRGDPFVQTVTSLLGDSSDWKPDDPEQQFRKHLPGRGAKTRPLLATVRAKPLFDSFDDPMGVVITATIHPELKEVLAAYQLTSREAEVLEYLAAGLSIGRTAAMLFITERTVKAHITSIYRKTGAENRVELLNMLGPAG